jgi:hypothetical protein
LQDNGDLTLTIGLADENQAIDEVDGCSGPTLDQRVMLHPEGEACDIEAGEVQSDTLIPTLSEWGMIFMSLLLAATAFREIRRRHIL